MRRAAHTDGRWRHSSHGKKITLFGGEPEIFWRLTRDFIDKGYQPCLYLFVDTREGLQEDIEVDNQPAYQGKYTIAETFIEAIDYCTHLVVDLKNARYQAFIAQLKEFDLHEHVVEVTTDGIKWAKFHGDVELFRSLVSKSPEDGGLVPARLPKEIRAANY